MPSAAPAGTRRSAVIVLTGAGDRAFCTGADQSAHEGSYGGRGTIGLPIDEVQSLIRDVPKPVIARVQGYAIGGGNVLATLCDLTIASEKAVFGQVGPKVGSVDPGFGTAYLARLVGEKRAREIWYLCRRYTREGGLRHGAGQRGGAARQARRRGRQVVRGNQGDEPDRDRHRQALVQRRQREVPRPSARSASRRWRCSTAPRNRRRAAAPSARSARRNFADDQQEHGLGTIRAHPRDGGTRAGWGASRNSAKPRSPSARRSAVAAALPAAAAPRDLAAGAPGPALQHCGIANSAPSPSSSRTSWSNWSISATVSARHSTTSSDDTS